MNSLARPLTPCCRLSSPPSLVPSPSPVSSPSLPLTLPCRWADGSKRTSRARVESGEVVDMGVKGVPVARMSWWWVKEGAGAGCPT